LEQVYLEWHVSKSPIPEKSLGKVEPMSGGYIKPQSSFEHQIVVFTFAGELKKGDVDDWNDFVKALKRTFGPNLTGITIKGDPTPVKFRVKRKKKK
jgi:hypothetical protein